MTKDKEHKSYEPLEVTDVRVYPYAHRVGNSVALARVELCGQLQLTGLRILDGVNGMFVSYPNDPSNKGEDDYRSIFYPITRELRDRIEKAVIEKYMESALLPDDSVEAVEQEEAK